VKHSYLISVQEGVDSAAALEAFPLVKVVDEFLFMSSDNVVPEYARHSRELAAVRVDHVKVFLGIDINGS